MDDNKVGVILEEIRDMFKTLAEGQKIIEDDGKDLKGRMDRIEKDVKIIKTVVIAADDGLNDHEKRITALEKKTASL